MSVRSLEGAYRTLLQNGSLLANKGQEALVQRLARLQVALSERDQSHDLNGLYIYGGVGTGKSRIADLFCTTLPHTVSTRRAHFHEFMLDVHSRLHRVRSASGYSDDPLPTVGRQIRDESRVLCFDEFQVTDIADAMILQRLFTSIWSNGGLMVSTSNRAPDALYENGLNRALFLPFIAQLKQRSELWKIDGTRDYRLLETSGRQETFFTDRRSFKECIKVAQGDQTPRLQRINVMMGRSLEVMATPMPEDPQSIIVQSTFSDLCRRSLGAADYIALCRQSKIIFVDGLRGFRADELDYARRFITLIDAAYEHGSRLVIRSEESLKQIFQAIVEAEARRVQSTQSRRMSVKKGGGSSSSMMSTFVDGETEWSATGLREASLATGGAGETDVVFAIERAVSRLHEMGSPVYGQRHAG